MRRVQDTRGWTSVVDKPVDLPTQRRALSFPISGVHRLATVAMLYPGICQTSHGDRRDTFHRIRYLDRDHKGVEFPNHDKALHSLEHRITLTLPHVRESCARVHATR